MLSLSLNYKIVISAIIWMPQYYLSNQGNFDQVYHNPHKELLIQPSQRKSTDIF